MLLLSGARHVKLLVRCIKITNHNCKTVVIQCNTTQYNTIYCKVIFILPFNCSILVSSTATILSAATSISSSIYIYNFFAFIEINYNQKGHVL